MAFSFTCDIMRLAYVLSYAENLRYVAQALDRYPNLYVDIGARIGELGRQPYTARWFLTQYADRVLFGTDISPNKKTYQIHFRCLETADEYFLLWQQPGALPRLWTVSAGRSATQDLLRERVQADPRLDPSQRG
jgi:hypothetical protein